jgi:glycosyltransferase involved in cell wall biosynthesis
MRLTTDSANGAARPGRSYVVITPCRDEAKYARATLDSMIAQTERPTLWVVVDDGSKDGTTEILEDYAAKHPWIRVVRRQDRGARVVGAGVMEAFYYGLDTVDMNAFDYVCKLDLDLDLPKQYFETLMDRMEADPRMGACSGKPYFLQDGRAVSEKCGDEHAVGMTKFYRTACFQQIGGFVRELMWDGIDTHRSRMLGWKAASWDDESLRFIHLRPMGTSHKSWLTGRTRHGRGQYYMGTSPGYMFVSALNRALHPPVVLGGLAMLWGYFKAMATGGKRYDDLAFRRFVRAYQRACLFKGKRKATQQLEDVQATVWRGPSR